MCDHVPAAQAAEQRACNYYGGLGGPWDHKLFTFVLSCDPAVQARQLRILNAAVLEIQDFVPGLYEGKEAPVRVSESEKKYYYEGPRGETYESDEPIKDFFNPANYDPTSYSDGHTYDRT